MNWIYNTTDFVFHSVGVVNPAMPIGSLWQYGEYADWVLVSWKDNGNGYLDPSDFITLYSESQMNDWGIAYEMEWHVEEIIPTVPPPVPDIYTLVLHPSEQLEFHVEKVIVLGGIYYQLILTPKFIDTTWKFHIRQGVKWQDPKYGTVNPFDVEVSIERGMLMDHKGGPQWMFFEPLTGSFGTRSGSYNVPIYKYWDPKMPDETARVGRWMDDSVESDLEFVWFNLVKPYTPFMQILCQSWGSVLDADWLVERGAWNLGWHVPTHTFEGYLSWRAYNNPVTPGPVGFNSMGCGPYYVFDVDSTTGYFVLKSFDNYWFGWTKPHCDTIVHEVVLEWATRKARFLTNSPEEQADQIAIERVNVEDVDLVAAVADGRVRYMKDLPALSAEAIMWSYDFDDSLYPHYIGTSGGFVTNATLLSDIDMRLAITKCFNASQLIDEFFLGEARTLHDPIIPGIAYANLTKHNTMTYQKNIAEATQHFKDAWGGQIWQYGFKVQIVPFPSGLARETPVDMIKYVVENEIEWPVGVDVEVIKTPLGWSPGLTAMYQFQLGAYICGWLADFPDPHNWVYPFMHSNGDFSTFQSVDYGMKLTGGTFGNRVKHAQTLNWHPLGNYGQAGLPYTNYKGDVVTEIDTDYVNGLIETGIGITDLALRERCYTELMDIYYAECASIMEAQVNGRHYERSWVQGWFYQSIYPGLMFYGTCNTMNLWKQDPQTVTRDLTASAHIVWSDELNRYILSYDIHNAGINPEAYNCVITYWLSMGQPITLTVTGWVRAAAADEFELAPVGQLSTWGAAIKVVVSMGPWINPIVESTTANNKVTIMAAKVAGDLGSHTPGIYFYFDGKVNADDLTLFVNSFQYYKVPPNPTAADPFAG